MNSLLRRSAGLRVIVTSTKRIGISGSLEWTVEALRSADAEALFVDRASSAEPSATFDGKERAIIGSICSALDGIPLAIELAARRTRLHSLATIFAEANEAHELLPRVGVFRGEFTVEMVAGVCVTDGRIAASLLEEVVNSNLVSVASLEDTVRYEAPTGTIAGNMTGLAVPNAIALQAPDKIYVANSSTGVAGGSITVYTGIPTGTLNEAPFATITGTNTVFLGSPAGIAVH